METHNETACEDCGHDLHEFAEGTADATTLERFVARLKRRDRCQRCYDTYKKTSELCRQHLAKDSSPDFGDRLSAFLRANGCCEEES